MCPLGRPQDYYAVLGVSVTATDAELRQAYKRKALEHHPDKNPHRLVEATEAFKLVAEAYTVLSDRRRRSRYNCSRGESSFGSPTSSSDQEDRHFNMSRAMDLFKEMFGEELVAGVGRAAEELLPKVGAAVMPLSEAVATAMHRCRNSEVVKETFSIGLRRVLQDKTGVVERFDHEKEMGQQAFEEAEKRLRLHLDKQRNAGQQSLLQERKAEDAVVRAFRDFALALLTTPSTWTFLCSWPSTPFLDPNIGALVAFLVIIFSFSRSLFSWWRFCEERDQSISTRQKATQEEQALRAALERARQARDDVLRKLENARAEAAMAQQDLKSTEENGASINNAARLGWHFANKLLHRSGLLKED